MIRMIEQVTGRTTNTRTVLRRELIPGALLILAGIVTGLTWRLLVPYFLDHSDKQESLFASDGTLAALGALAGVVTGVVVVFRPGHTPAARAAVVVIGSIGASLLAWVTGVTFGAPTLKASGVTLVWPVFASIVMFTGAMLPLTSERISSADAG